VLAACFDSLNDWSLVIGRVSIFGVGAYGLFVIGSILLWQPKQQVERTVPRPVLAFTGIWLLLLLAVTVAITIDGCDTALSPLKRTMFGSSLTWALAGMAWIVHYGARWRRKVIAEATRAKTVAEIVAPIADRELGEL
jgi:hypothetical protein